MLQRKKDLISGPALHSSCILRTAYAVQTFQKNSVQGRFGVCETERYGSVYDYSRAQITLSSPTEAFASVCTACQ